MPMAAEPGATCVVKLANAVTEEELRDDQEFSDILEDMREECRKFGNLRGVVIPRPADDPSAPRPAGLGFVFLQYADTAGASAAKRSLHGARGRLRLGARGGLLSRCACGHVRDEGFRS